MQPTSEAPASLMSDVLGANTSYRGVLKTDGNIRIDGLYQGRIETAGNVIVGPDATVVADIIANTVQVWGAVRGQIIARGRLEVLPSGHVWGDVEVSSLLVDEGGTFRGQCLMTGTEPPTLVTEEGREQVVRERPAATASILEGQDDPSSFRDWQGAEPSPLGSESSGLGGIDE